MRKVLAFLVALWIPTLVHAQDGSASEIKTGAFQTVFTERSPLSDPKRLVEAVRFRPEDILTYRIAEETFEMYVPPTYDGKDKYGLLVWVNAAPGGTLPNNWRALMDVHRLIGVGANNSGNNRQSTVRTGLALDAVHNVTKQYKIDDARIYITGISGGAKMACLLAINYPDVFDGAIPIVGVSYHRGIPVPGQVNRIYPPGLARPPAELFKLAQERQRLALITGSDDFNHDSVTSTFKEGFAKDRYKYAKLFDIEGMGHTLPRTEHMDEAIQFLDAPLAELASASKPYDRSTAEVSEQGEVSIGSDEVPPPPQEPEVAAKSDLSMARNYIAFKKYPEARRRLNRILSDYSQTTSVAEAKRLLKEIEKKK